MKIHDVVECIPLFCEQQQCGPGVADEGRCESLISELKKNNVRTDDPLSWLPDTYEMTAERHRRDGSRQKTPILSHQLLDARAEIIAPCVVNQFLHMRDNWQGFEERWLALHSAFSRHFDGAYRFGVAMPGESRTVLHCVCLGHQHLLELPDERWSPHLRTQ